ncbi:hypothetical protein BWD13_09100 [Leptospira santarosai serovar Grippotyphosa]|nr:hypothetical protein BWD13_09100 [Leptospira santarosai serovar Grippotyphosa]
MAACCRNAGRSIGSRLETQRNAFLRVAFGNSAKRFPMGRVWKLSETLSYGSRLETQRNAFLWVAFGNSAKRFPMGRVSGSYSIRFMRPS